MKRIFIFILLFTFIFTLLPLQAMAEDVRPGYDEGSYTVTATFDVATIGESRTWDFEYNDAWFTKPATGYNHKLARLSYGLALSTFRPSFDEAAADDPSLHIKDFLTQAGFTELRSDDYDKNPSIYTISTVMGYKVLHDDEGPFIQLAVGVCGGGYRNEWLSNVTVGDGIIHQGFNAAASLVYDRIHGYIASNHLYGKRFKVWVAGFSRAAAVSNILGAKLTDDDLFSENDVYCYTFATPRTTRDPKRGQYMNIFNICGKMDPVTQVPFADWGYDRYGTTLFTPSQQTDSHYIDIAVNADKAYQQAEGLNFWNNVEWDTKLRLLLNYLVKIAPTPEIYAKEMQHNIVNILADKSISNIMTQLMEIANNKNLITEENQNEANSLLTFLAYTIYGYFTQSDIESKYRNDKASSMANLVHEHMPDVYLAWLFATDDPKEMYNSNISYRRVVITGDVDTALFTTEGTLECIQGLDHKGNSIKTYSKDGKDFSVTGSRKIFIERSGKTTIILLPKDDEYLISMTANSNERVELHSIDLLVGRTNGNFSRLNYIDMAKGDTQSVLAPKNGDLDGEIVVGDTFDVVDISNRSTTDLALSLERNNFLNLNWRQMVVLFFMIPVVVISLLFMFMTWLTGGAVLMRQRRRGVVAKDVKYDKRPAFLIYTAIAVFLLQELLFWLMPQYLMQRAFLKLIIGICLIALCYQGYVRQYSKLSLGLLFSLIVFMAGDLIINFNFTLAMGLFAIAQLILAVNFMLFDKPEKWQWIFWAIASAIASVIIYFAGSSLGDIKYAMMGYAVILMLLFTMSLTLPKKVRIGSILFAVSNVLLFVNEIRNASLFSHILALSIYYIAMGCYAFGARFKVRENIVRDEPEERPEGPSTELAF